MAIFHFSAQRISRVDNRSSTAAAAYRSGSRLIDTRTGEIHDYSRKRGVEHAELFMPGGQATGRGVFWSSVESKHKRGDATLVWEINAALPAELSKEERLELARDYARSLAVEYGVGVDLAIHAPSAAAEVEFGGPDQRNHHLHIMLSACAVGLDGALGKKVEALDPIACQRGRKENMVQTQRPRWETLCNTALERSGRAERIDHRTLAAQGIKRLPTVHLGPAATGIDRRGERSRIGDENRERAERSQAVASARLAVQAAALEAARLDEEIAVLEREAEADELAEMKAEAEAEVEAGKVAARARAEEARRAADEAARQAIKAAQAHVAAQTPFEQLRALLPELDAAAADVGRLEGEIHAGRGGGLIGQLLELLAVARQTLQVVLDKAKALANLVRGGDVGGAQRVEAYAQKALDKAYQAANPEGLEYGERPVPVDPDPDSDPDPDEDRGAGHGHKG